MRIDRGACIALIAAMSTTASLAHAAGSTSGTLDTSVTVVDGCLLGGASSGTPDLGTIDFGTRSFVTSAADADSSGASPGLTVQCSNTLAYAISIDKGTNGATISDRKLSNGTDTLDYQLYTTSGRTAVWGDGSTGTTVTGTGDGTEVTHTVYARIPSQTIQSAGTYTDTVSVTVSW